jgi:hypothetical protein
VLESLRRSSIVQKEGQNPYPTPDSGREASSQVEEDVLLSMDLGKFGSANLDGTMIGGMLADARKSKGEGRRSLSRRSAGLVGYQGFWNGSESPTVR